ncbi:chondroitin AC/alginate lyase [Tilletiaria anomala UBC 951]|uniref:Chondroitin AC/alginate lyase n=1 Tax=Tilletiaria anomala (strain ATCC 24038 / CBS 436.72 / UBC 951) TaxID=1037660 RepID=A0A066VRD2_TILAU|nr:chondroitin AC/alginate lyase [Tilletiaria anomala UBC 951]KDN41150.1 chondroitin AC/alginate lyase [Tilletiaria anomala UBC 951]
MGKWVKHAFGLSRTVLLCLVAARSVQADGNDWVSPLYVMDVSNGQIDASGSINAQSRIQQAGVWSAKAGPWSVLNQKVSTPSGDKHDYLSWAPYWWPDCNWCGQNSAQSDGDNGDDPNYPDSSSSSSSWLSSATLATSLPPDANPTAHPYQPLDPVGGVVQATALPIQPYQAPVPILPQVQAANPFSVSGQLLETNAHAGVNPALARRRLRGANALWSANSLPEIAEGNAFRMAEVDAMVARDPPPLEETRVAPAHTAQPTHPSRRTGHAHNWLVHQHAHQLLVAASHNAYTTSQTQAPTPSLQNRGSINTGTSTGAAQLQGKAMDGNKNSCTPSSTSVAPAATWTTCPYKRKDGKVNPDTKMLNNTKDVVSMAQSVLWNGVAFGLTNDTSYSQRATSLIYNWFLNPQTAVNPNLNYGQVIRGPGQQLGDFTGILDWRMILKVVNAIVIMRAKSAQAWNAVIASSMNQWASNYLDWLAKSSQGKGVAKASNNHATFFYNQLIALYILVGDIQSAQQAANAYFTGAFMSQIDEDGEQPYEATRTRPFHYRCFNVEGMIANAKLADNLALNMWSATTSKGATIQSAVDYLMTLDPGDENITELAPHVAAVASAYGDPDGKYAAWLSNSDNTGDDDNSQSWRFYDNSAALYCNPASGDQTSSQSFKSS